MSSRPILGNLWAACDTDGHGASPDQIFPGVLVPLEHAVSVARHRSHKGVPQEVVIRPRFFTGVAGLAPWP